MLKERGEQCKCLDKNRGIFENGMQRKQQLLCFLDERNEEENYSENKEEIQFRYWVKVKEILVKVFGKDVEFVGFVGIML